MLIILKFCTPVILIAEYMSLKCNLVLVNNVKILKNMYFNESCVVFFNFSFVHLNDVRTWVS